MRIFFALEKMVKKTIIAVVLVFLLAVVFVNGYQRWGTTSYGAVYYYGQPFYMYYPLPYYPQSGMYYPYNYPQYAYPYYGPLSTESMYTRGTPEVRSDYLNYPSGIPRGKLGQLCGLVDSKQYGCELGFVCDYTKTNQSGVGVCSTQSVYPYYI